jgi:predicted nuclease of restriction endonuclease-like (RecB) superfamily
LVAEISWSKNVLIMERCKDDLERMFYIKSVKKFGWTKNVLLHNLESAAFHMFMINQTNFDETLPTEFRNQAKLAVKDEYNFDFLEMGLAHSEAELESALVANIRSFLTEVGNDFTFIGNQYHIAVEDHDYFIDILLFHRRLKCLVAIELKIGEFEPEHSGKMQFYLTVLDDMKKLEDENPSIGIIICKSKNRTIVEYALKNTSKPIGVATYNIYQTLPDDLASLLPSPEKMAALVEAYL